MENVQKTAVIVLDVQNDFCDDEGALAKHLGWKTTQIKKMVPGIATFTDAKRGKGALIVFSRMVNSKNEQIKERIRECRVVLKELNTRGIIQYSIGETRQTPEEIVDTWINGHYFHEDEDKKRQLDPKSMGHMTHKFIFIKNVVDPAHVLFILRNILKSEGLCPDKSEC